MTETIKSSETGKLICPLRWPLCCF